MQGERVGLKNEDVKLFKQAFSQSPRSESKQIDLAYEILEYLQSTSKTEKSQHNHP